MRALRTTVVAGIAWILVSAGSVDDARAQSDNQTCALDDVSFMAFGSYDPMNDAPLDLMGQVSYRCFIKSGSTAAPLTSAPVVSTIAVEISISQGGSGSFDRRMSGGRDDLRYNLYTDALYQVIWVDGSSGTSVYVTRGQPNNKVETVPVFGRIPGGQDVTSGQYLDNVVVTLNF